MDAELRRLHVAMLRGGFSHIDMMIGEEKIYEDCLKIRIFKWYIRMLIGVYNAKIKPEGT